LLFHEHEEQHENNQRLRFRVASSPFLCASPLLPAKWPSRRYPTQRVLHHIHHPSSIIHHPSSIIHHHHHHHQNPQSSFFILANGNLGNKQ